LCSIKGISAETLGYAYEESDTTSSCSFPFRYPSYIPAYWYILVALTIVDVVMVGVRGKFCLSFLGADHTMIAITVGCNKAVDLRSAVEIVLDTNPFINIKIYNYMKRQSNSDR